MGRGCTMDEWAHFQKLPEEGRVPNSSYWYVMCRHCMLAYEQKQLQNAPAKITGRRSAMHAHLKACPIYGAEYNMEQQAKAEVDAQEAEDTATDLTDASTTTTTGKKRKRRSSGLRGGRGKHCMMEEWEHFNRLQEDGYIGKSNFFHAICRYCQQAYDEASEDQKPLLVPEKLVGRREKLRKHLVHCSNFKGELPSLERQIRHRIGDIPHSAVISTLAAKVTAETGTVDGMVDPAVGVVVAQTNTAAGSTGSTRMMLDEWQYFTRMERKKDSAYYHARCNFCQQAYENAPESLKASMEPPYVTGRKSNMQTHLAKCPHIPQELVSTKTYNAGLNHSSETEAATTPPDAIVPLAAKRINQDAPQTLQAASPDGSTVHRALVELLLEHHLPFDWVESASAKKLFCALVPMPTVANALMPSTIGLRTYILDEIHNATLASELTKLQELVPLELAASAFSACVTNALGDAPVSSWPVMLHCNVTASQSQAESVQVPTISGIVTNGKAIVPLSFVRDQNPQAEIGTIVIHHHGLEVARWLDEHIRICIDTVKLAPVAVVLPFSTVTQRAVGILRAPTHWPRVVFTANVEDLLYFPLIKLLATAEMFGVVSSLIELWQLESIRSCVVERLSEMKGGSPSSPFSDWRSCAILIQVFLDDKTFEVSAKRGAANAKRLVESALNRTLLERVYNLLRAFINAFSSCRTGLTLSETLKHLGALFVAADGIITVQLALEVVWAQLEQPLFVLAHALDPRLRLRNLGSTEITKLSALSDVSVAYFISLFGRKPSSLRGEVTAYLHTSQRAFTSDVISEFPVVDDYFRYLSDNHPSLAMLMQVLHSFSPVSTAKHSVQEGAMKTAADNYTREEQQKLEYLRDRWGLAPTLETDGGDETKGRIAAHNSRSGAALLNAGVVVDEWKEALEAKLHMRGVDFALLDDKFDGIDDVDIVSDYSEQDAMNRVASAHGPKLPSLALDDKMTFPSASLREPFSKKVLLKDLFKTVEATI